MTNNYSQQNMKELNGQDISHCLLALLEQSKYNSYNNKATFKVLQEGICIYKPSVYGTISLQQLEQVFRSSNNTRIPLLEKRLENLHEAAKVLNEV